MRVCYNGSKKKEGWGVPMEQKTAVWFMPDSVTKTDEKIPLYLQPVLFCPVLTWTCAALIGRGIERLFLVSAAEAHEEMRPHVPEGLAVEWIDGARHAEALSALLERESGSVLILNGVVLPVGVFSGGAVYTAPADACRAVLRENGAFAAIPQGAEVCQGFLPVGDAEELRAALPMCRQKILEKHLQGGVAILDTNNTYIDPRVSIGSGTVILPGSILRGASVIGRDCTIGPNAVVNACTVGDGTEINASQVNESEIGSHTTVGPFAYVRPNCRIGDHIRVGDFVEIKNSVIGNGTKISHLTYVGDSDVGERINFGCGTVTTNYDGHKKYRTTIGDDAFIGCNTNLIAPVRVGARSYIAAGSTITDEVPEDSLAVARSKQAVREGWAAKRRKLWEQEKKTK